MIRVFTKRYFQNRLNIAPIFFVSFFTRYRLLQCIQKYQRRSSLGLEYHIIQLTIILICYFILQVIIEKMQSFPIFSKPQKPPPCGRHKWMTLIRHITESKIDRGFVTF